MSIRRPPIAAMLTPGITGPVVGRLGAAIAGALARPQPTLTYDFRDGLSASESFDAYGRASGGYARDWLGRYVPVPIGAPVVHGLNPVRNLLRFASENLTDGSYSADGITPYPDYIEIAAPGYITKTIFSSVTSGSIYLVSVDFLHPGTAVGTLGVRAHSASNSWSKITSVNFEGIIYPYTHVFTVQATDSQNMLISFEGRSGLGGDGVITGTVPITNVALYDITGQVDSAGDPVIPPYVSVRVGTGPNLLTGNNSTFDSGIGNWNAVGSPSLTHNATDGALRVTRTATGSIEGCYINLATEAGLSAEDQYLEFKVRMRRSNTNNVALRYRLSIGDTATAITGLAPNDGQWHDITLTTQRLVSTGNTYLYLWMDTVNATVGDWFEIDNVEIRELDPGHTGVDGFAYFDTDNQGNALPASGALQVQSSAVTNLADTADALASPDTINLGTGTYTLRVSGDAAVTVAAGTATITGGGQATVAAERTFVVTGAGTVTLTKDSGTLDTTTDGRQVIWLVSGSSATGLPPISGTLAAANPVPKYDAAAGKDVVVDYLASDGTAARKTVEAWNGEITGTALGITEPFQVTRLDVYEPGEAP